MAALGYVYTLKKQTCTSRNATSTAAKFSLKISRDLEMSEKAYRNKTLNETTVSVILCDTTRQAADNNIKTHCYKLSLSALHSILHL